MQNSDKHVAWNLNLSISHSSKAIIDPQVNWSHYQFSHLNIPVWSKCYKTKKGIVKCCNNLIWKKGKPAPTENWASSFLLLLLVLNHEDNPRGFSDSPYSFTYKVKFSKVCLHFSSILKIGQKELNINGLMNKYFVSPGLSTFFHSYSCFN